ncbi:uncharacterized protein AMSG_12099 [Thecamonas trahens ATCC 50062]|uniref:Uncharacterized protein n=1 Tax=Thecamonas trahens ATCC 50062 TaxID=461836 RepID=A0A0L0DHV1_THETB|nr:hypothetical protein AMSG_12099 [Thecamonas trahens ATCC 50062]KNC51681.1 hypothetical protein AMSG_12099 [Thecamonas trahens ATCC 50062]|eukprot:XP_013755900.1 hypothetical protein AMSG_12099 [Thecamonas trahens ATCC 50062]
MSGRPSDTVSPLRGEHVPGELPVEAYEAAETLAHKLAAALAAYTAALQQAAADLPAAAVAAVPALAEAADALMDNAAGLAATGAALAAVTAPQGAVRQAADALTAAVRPLAQVEAAEDTALAVCKAAEARVAAAASAGMQSSMGEAAAELTLAESKFVRASAAAAAVRSEVRAAAAGVAAARRRRVETLARTVTRALAPVPGSATSSSANTSLDSESDSCSMSDSDAGSSAASGPITPLRITEDIDDGEDEASISDSPGRASATPLTGVNALVARAMKKPRGTRSQTMAAKLAGGIGAKHMRLRAVSLQVGRPRSLSISSTTSVASVLAVHHAREGEDHALAEDEAVRAIRTTTRLEGDYEWSLQHRQWVLRQPKTIHDLVQARGRFAQVLESTGLPADDAEAAVIVEALETAFARKRYKLDLRASGLHSLPGGLLPAFVHLEELNLSRNELTDLPPQIGLLASLVKLNVSHNALTSVPAHIGHLSSLQWLYLRGNALTSLPETIGSLVSLRGLNVANNQLRELPASCCNLLELIECNLSYNLFTELPTMLAACRALCTLYLVGNPMFRKSRGSARPQSNSVSLLSNVSARSRSSSTSRSSAPALPDIPALGMSPPPAMRSATITPRRAAAGAASVVESPQPRLAGQGESATRGTQTPGWESTGMDNVLGASLATPAAVEAFMAARADALDAGLSALQPGPYIEFMEAKVASLARGLDQAVSVVTAEREQVARLTARLGRAIPVVISTSTQTRHEPSGDHASALVEAVDAMSSLLHGTESGTVTGASPGVQAQVAEVLVETLAATTARVAALEASVAELEDELHEQAEVATLAKVEASQAKMDAAAGLAATHKELLPLLVDSFGLPAANVEALDAQSAAAVLGQLMRESETMAKTSLANAQTELETLRAEVGPARVAMCATGRENKMRARALQIIAIGHGVPRETAVVLAESVVANRFSFSVDEVAAEVRTACKDCCLPEDAVISVADGIVAAEHAFVRGMAPMDGAQFALRVQAGALASQAELGAAADVAESLSMAPEPARELAFAVAGRAAVEAGAVEVAAARELVEARAAILEMDSALLRALGASDRAAADGAAAMLSSSVLPGVPRASVVESAVHDLGEAERAGRGLVAAHMAVAHGMAPRDAIGFALEVLADCGSTASSIAEAAEARMHDAAGNGSGLARSLVERWTSDEWRRADQVTMTGLGYERENAQAFAATAGSAIGSLGEAAAVSGVGSRGLLAAKVARRASECGLQPMSAAQFAVASDGARTREDIILAARHAGVGNDTGAAELARVVLDARRSFNADQFAEVVTGLAVDAGTGTDAAEQFGLAVANWDGVAETCEIARVARTLGVGDAAAARLACDVSVAHEAMTVGLDPSAAFEIASVAHQEGKAHSVLEAATAAGLDEADARRLATAAASTAGLGVVAAVATRLGLSSEAANELAAAVTSSGRFDERNVAALAASCVAAGLDKVATGAVARQVRLARQACLCGLGVNAAAEWAALVTDGDDGPQAACAFALEHGGSLRQVAVLAESARYEAELAQLRDELAGAKAELARVVPHDAVHQISSVSEGDRRVLANRLSDVEALVMAEQAVARGVELEVAIAAATRVHEAGASGSYSAVAELCTEAGVPNAVVASVASAIVARNGTQLTMDAENAHASGGAIVADWANVDARGLVAAALAGSLSDDDVKAELARRGVDDASVASVMGAVRAARVAKACGIGDEAVAARLGCLVADNSVSLDEISQAARASGLDSNDAVRLVRSVSLELAPQQAWQRPAEELAMESKHARELATRLAESEPGSARLTEVTMLPGVSSAVAADVARGVVATRVGLAHGLELDAAVSVATREISAEAACRKSGVSTDDAHACITALAGDKAIQYVVQRIVPSLAASATAAEALAALEDFADRHAGSQEMYEYTGSAVAAEVFALGDELTLAGTVSVAEEHGLTAEHAAEFARTVMAARDAMGFGKLHAGELSVASAAAAGVEEDMPETATFDEQLQVAAKAVSDILQPADARHTEWLEADRALAIEHGMSPTKGSEFAAAVVAMKGRLNVANVAAAAIAAGIADDMAAPLAADVAAVQRGSSWGATPAQAAIVVTRTRALQGASVAEVVDLAVEVGVDASAAEDVAFAVMGKTELDALKAELAEAQAEIARLLPASMLAGTTPMSLRAQVVALCEHVGTTLRPLEEKRIARREADCRLAGDAGLDDLSAAAVADALATLSADQPSKAEIAAAVTAAGVEESAVPGLVAAIETSRAAEARGATPAQAALIAAQTRAMESANTTTMAAAAVETGMDATVAEEVAFAVVGKAEHGALKAELAEAQAEIARLLPASMLAGTTPMSLREQVVALREYVGTTLRPLEEKRIARREADCRLAVDTGLDDSSAAAVADALATLSADQPSKAEIAAAVTAAGVEEPAVPGLVAAIGTSRAAEARGATPAQAAVITTRACAMESANTSTVAAAAVEAGMDATAAEEVAFAVAGKTELEAARTMMARVIGTDVAEAAPFGEQLATVEQIVTEQLEPQRLRRAELMEADKGFAVEHGMSPDEGAMFAVAVASLEGVPNVANVAEAAVAAGMDASGVEALAADVVAVRGASSRGATPVQAALIAAQIRAMEGADTTTVATAAIEAGIDATAAEEVAFAVVGKAELDALKAELAEAQAEIARLLPASMSAGTTPTSLREQVVALREYVGTTLRPLEEKRIARREADARLAVDTGLDDSSAAAVADALATLSADKPSNAEIAAAVTAAGVEESAVPGLVAAIETSRAAEARGATPAQAALIAAQTRAMESANTTTMAAAAVETGMDATVAEEVAFAVVGKAEHGALKAELAEAQAEIAQLLGNDDMAFVAAPTSLRDQVVALREHVETTLRPLEDKRIARREADARLSVDTGLDDSSAAAVADALATLSADKPSNAEIAAAVTAAGVEESAVPGLVAAIGTSRAAEARGATPAQAAVIATRAGVMESVDTAMVAAAAVEAGMDAAAAEEVAFAVVGKTELEALKAELAEAQAEIARLLGNDEMASVAAPTSLREQIVALREHVESTLRPLEEKRIARREADGRLAGDAGLDDSSAAAVADALATLSADQPSKAEIAAAVTCAGVEESAVPGLVAAIETSRAAEARGATPAQAALIAAQTRAMESANTTTMAAAAVEAGMDATAAEEVAFAVAGKTEHEALKAELAEAQAEIARLLGNDEMAPVAAPTSLREQVVALREHVESALRPLEEKRIARREADARLAVDTGLDDSSAAAVADALATLSADKPSNAEIAAAVTAAGVEESAVLGLVAAIETSRAAEARGATPAQAAVIAARSHAIGAADTAMVAAAAVEVGVDATAAEEVAFAVVGKTELDALKAELAEAQAEIARLLGNDDMASSAAPTSLREQVVALREHVESTLRPLEEKRVARREADARLAGDAGLDDSSAAAVADALATLSADQPSKAEIAAAVTAAGVEESAVPGLVAAIETSRAAEARGATPAQAALIAAQTRAMESANTSTVAAAAVEAGMDATAAEEVAFAVAGKTELEAARAMMARVVGTDVAEAAPFGEQLATVEQIVTEQLEPQRLRRAELMEADKGFAVEHGMSPDEGAMFAVAVASLEGVPNVANVAEAAVAAGMDASGVEALAADVVAVRGASSRGATPVQAALIAAQIRAMEGVDTAMVAAAAVETGMDAAAAEELAFAVVGKAELDALKAELAEAQAEIARLLGNDEMAPVAAPTSLRDQVVALREHVETTLRPLEDKRIARREADARLSVDTGLDDSSAAAVADALATLSADQPSKAEIAAAVTAAGVEESAVPGLVAAIETSRAVEARGATPAQAAVITTRACAMESANTSTVAAAAVEAGMDATAAEEVAFAVAGKTEHEALKAELAEAQAEIARLLGNDEMAPVAAPTSLREQVVPLREHGADTTTVATAAIEAGIDATAAEEVAFAVVGKTELEAARAMMARVVGTDVAEAATLGEQLATVEQIVTEQLEPQRVRRAELMAADKGFAVEHGMSPDEGAMFAVAVASLEGVPNVANVAEAAVAAGMDASGVEALAADVVAVRGASSRGATPVQAALIAAQIRAMEGADTTTVATAAIEAGIDATAAEEVAFAVVGKAELDALKAELAEAQAEIARLLPASMSFVAAPTSLRDQVVTLREHVETTLRPLEDKRIARREADARLSVDTGLDDSSAAAVADALATLSADKPSTAEIAAAVTGAGVEESAVPGLVAAIKTSRAAEARGATPAQAALIATRAGAMESVDTTTVAATAIEAGMDAAAAEEVAFAVVGKAELDALKADLAEAQAEIARLLPASMSAGTTPTSLREQVVALREHVGTTLRPLEDKRIARREADARLSVDTGLDDSSAAAVADALATLSADKPSNAEIAAAVTCAGVEESAVPGLVAAIKTSRAAEARGATPAQAALITTRACAMESVDTTTVTATAIEAGMDATAAEEVAFAVVGKAEHGALKAELAEAQAEIARLLGNDEMAPVAAPTSLREQVVALREHVETTLRPLEEKRIARREADARLAGDTGLDDSSAAAVADALATLSADQPSKAEIAAAVTAAGVEESAVPGLVSAIGTSRAAEARGATPAQAAVIATRAGVMESADTAMVAAAAVEAGVDAGAAEEVAFAVVGKAELDALKAELAEAQAEIARLLGNDEMAPVAAPTSLREQIVALREHVESTLRPLEDKRIARREADARLAGDAGLDDLSAAAVADALATLSADKPSTAEIAAAVTAAGVEESAVPGLVAAIETSRAVEARGATPAQAAVITTRACAMAGADTSTVAAAAVEAGMDAAAAEEVAFAVAGKTEHEALKAELAEAQAEIARLLDASTLAGTESLMEQLVALRERVESTVVPLEEIRAARRDADTRLACDLGLDKDSAHALADALATDEVVPARSAAQLSLVIEAVEPNCADVAELVRALACSRLAEFHGAGPSQAAQVAAAAHALAADSAAGTVSVADIFRAGVAAGMPPDLAHSVAVAVAENIELDVLRTGRADPTSVANARLAALAGLACLSGLDDASADALAEELVALGDGMTLADAENALAGGSVADAADVARRLMLANEAVIHGLSPESAIHAENAAVRDAISQLTGNSDSDSLTDDLMDFSAFLASSLRQQTEQDMHRRVADARLAETFGLSSPQAADFAERLADGPAMPPVIETAALVHEDMGLPRIAAVQLARTVAVAREAEAFGLEPETAAAFALAVKEFGPGHAPSIAAVAEREPFGVPSETARVLANVVAVLKGGDVFAPGLVDSLRRQVDELEMELNDLTDRSMEALSASQTLDEQVTMFKDSAAFRSMQTLREAVQAVATEMGLPADEVPVMATRVARSVDPVSATSERVADVAATCALDEETAAELGRRVMLAVPALTHGLPAHSAAVFARQASENSLVSPEDVAAVAEASGLEPAAANSLAYSLVGGKEIIRLRTELDAAQRKLLVLAAEPSAGGSKIALERTVQLMEAQAAMETVEVNTRQLRESLLAALQETPELPEAAQALLLSTADALAHAMDNLAHHIPGQSNSSGDELAPRPPLPKSLSRAHLQITDALKDASLSPGVGKVLITVAEALNDALASTAVAARAAPLSLQPTLTVTGAEEETPMTRLQSTLLSTARVLALTLDNVEREGDATSLDDLVLQNRATLIDLDGVIDAIRRLAAACTRFEEQLTAPGARVTLHALEGVVPELADRCLVVSHAVETSIGQLSALADIVPQLE